MAAVGKAATASKAVVKISQMTPEYLENTIKFTQEAMDENHSMQVGAFFCCCCVWLLSWCRCCYQEKRPATGSCF